jgi:hypothetical protein
MMLRRVFLVLLLRQAEMRRFQHSSTYCQILAGSYGYFSLHQVPKAVTSEGPMAGNAYSLQETSRRV